MWKGCRRVSRGSVFLLAMVALVALLFLGTSLVQVAIHGLSFASTQQKRAQALALAESGIEMACEKIYADFDGAGTTLTNTGRYEDEYSFGEGTVSYVVTAPVPGIARSLEIRSTAVTRTNKRETIRMIGTFVDSVSSVFRGAIFCNSDLDLKGGGGVYPDENNMGGDIYAKGVINFDTQSAFTMTSYGSIYTATPAPHGISGAIPDEVLSSNVHEGISPLPMPAIDLDWYRKLVLEDGRGTYYSSGQTFTGGRTDFSTAGEIIFVEGNVKIGGHYSGNVAIVATGTITVIGGSLVHATESDTLALISPRGVKIDGGGEIDGLIYSHGIEVTGPGGVGAGGSVEIHGAIVADVVTCHGSLDVYYDPVYAGLVVPGNKAGQIKQVSWEELPG